MRRFYSLLLAAAFLLVGINAWGQFSTVQLVNHTNPSASKGYATLQAAIDAVAPGDTATITLSEDQNLIASIVIPNAVGESAQTFAARGKVVGRQPQRICLNLNGHDIVGDGALNQCCIALLKGVLHITGEGEIKKQGTDKGINSGWGRAAIAISGAPGNKNDDSKDFSKAGWWSTLIIDENVKVTAPDNFKSVGLAIMDIGGYMGTYYVGNQNFPAFIGVRQSGKSEDTDKLGYSDYNYYLNNADQTKKDALNIMWSRASNTNGDGTLQGSAFGVRVIVKGEIYGMNRGIFVYGPINQHPEDFPETGKHKETRTRYTIGTEHPYYYEHYFPWITIEKTAKVHCMASGTDDEEAGGVYAAGWAVFDISGEVYGQNGLYIKSGDIQLHDANIYSQDPQFGDDGWRNGKVAGNGIFMTTDAQYAGDMSVEVNGDSRIAGNGGAAIVEVVASIVTNPDVNNITINGGTIEGGSTGAIMVTEPTGDKTVAYGGTNITGATKKGGTESSVAAKGTYATEVTDPVTKKTTIVISDLGAGNSVKTVTENLTKTEEKYVKWTGTDDQYIFADMTLEYLEMNPSPAVAQKIYVGDATHHATLTVDRVVMGSLAQIIVAPGSSLVVKGEDGIVAPNVSNIILQHEGAVAMADRKHATFLFNPAVTSNKHPNATVELTTYSFANSASDYQWERFGVPTHNALKSISGSDVPTAFSVATLTGWQSLGYLDRPGYTDVKADVFNTPFATYELMAQRAYNPAAPTVGPKYQFAGELVGNANATLNVNKYWTGFTNSYSASIDVPAMFDVVEAGEIIAPFIYIAQPGGLGTYTWEPVDQYSDDFATMKIAPMQAFILAKTYGSTQTEEVVLNYNDMVYEPAVPSNNPAPARRMAVNNDFTARMRVVIANEQGVWDNVQLRETAMSLQNAEKYMNDDVNIYAMSDEKDAIYSVENLEDLYLGVSTIKGGNFTISFANVEGREFDLIDLETGARVAVNEGETYSFSAAANFANDYRFKLVERAKLPTAIENTEVKANVKGIYTITGQYLGEMNVWNTLPAGVYVVNGAKRVK